MVSATGVAGCRTWTLRSVETGKHYELAPASIEGWPLPAKREDSRPNSIIVNYDGNDVIALELATGELYRTRAPATTLRLRR